AREAPQDLLGAFYPGGGRYLCQAPKMTASGRVSADTPRGEPGVLQGSRVALTCTSPGRDARPAVTLTYALGADDPYLTVTSELLNTGERPLALPLEDAITVQGPSFERIADGDTPLWWAGDRWFGQAYGLSGDGVTARVSRIGDESVIRWLAAGS